MRKILAAASAGALWVLTAFTTNSALALEQPDGKTIPAPPGCNGGQTTGLAAEFACVCVEPNICNQGAACPGGSPSCDPGTNGTCETTTWHNVNDNPCIPSNQSGIDPQADAKIEPETFHPTCPQTFTVLSRGTAMFKNGFGWYNVTGQKPDLADLHVMIGCNAQAGTEAVLDLKSEPDYLGGDVGFFLMTPESHTAPGTCDSGDCCATLASVAAGEGHVYYSERKYNPDYVGDNSWIHLLIYESEIFPSKYYFAWEDSNKSPNNDFTDLLTGVSGIECSGAGVACDTGKQGICAAGITTCKGGSLSCIPLFSSKNEACNGVDDNCDGKIDDDAVCLNPGEICDHGTCVPPCDTGEFPCPAQLTCDDKTGLCVDPQCVDVNCNDGEVCQGGECGAPCAGVICPKGQTCVANACVDLCNGIDCPSGQVCKAGICFPGCAACDGISCEGATKCDVPSGACLDPSCPNGCPDGTFCSMGECKPACEGVVCPGSQVCTDGQCVFPGGGEGGFGMGGLGGAGGIGMGGFGMGAGGSGADDGEFNPLPGKACNCRAADVEGLNSSLETLAIGAVAIGLMRRRRRSSKRYFAEKRRA
ncbi:MAG: hypothetical protein IPK82_35985 [Polyangiaceae bacterium]|nr:hypothetical protein [Polyangiaceae bacterium]